MRAQIELLSDGRRLHLQDGPIDLIVEAFGEPNQIKAAYDSAAQRFVNVLDELCAELPLLRRRAGLNSSLPTGSTAGRMARAVMPYAEKVYITPMAAVAGAVAEEILESMTSGARLSKAYVNDGGDIAIQLAPGEQFVVGMIERPDRASLFGTVTLKSSNPVRGIATSGWRGRSFSLGIADAVTVLAQRATMADAAATMIANAVNLLNHASIDRAPANSIAPDSDLRDLLVTVNVGELSGEDIRCALESGVALANQLKARGLIHSAALHLQGETRIVGLDEKVLPHANTTPISRSPVHA